MGFGIVSGMATTLFLLPLQVVQTLQNVHSNRGSRMSVGDAFRLVIRERGVGGLFAGLAPSLVLSVYPALQHTVYEMLRKWYLRSMQKGKDEQLPAMPAFVFGIVANLTALTLTYPLIYVKIRVQAQKVSKEHHLGTIEVSAQFSLSFFNSHSSSFVDGKEDCFSRRCLGSVAGNAIANDKCVYFKCHSVFHQGKDSSSCIVWVAKKMNELTERREKKKKDERVVWRVASCQKSPRESFLSLSSPFLWRVLVF